MERRRLKITGKSAIRAQRFPIHIPIFYRGQGRKEWRNGITLNISKSGVLFLAEEALRPSTVVRIKMQLPAAIRGQAPGEILCDGRVIRVITGIASKDSPVLGATIHSYRLIRSKGSTTQPRPRRNTVS